jgi:tRNA-splicing ligase RtcB (3'-phosphate/5'-hydroxy nucleic acid ligase)
MIKHVEYDDNLKVPIKMWLNKSRGNGNKKGELYLDPDALKQARNLAKLPFGFRHISIMPDSHIGYGMPIGGVLATKSTVIPNAVGVDIGCGMCSLSTSLKVGDIQGDIVKKIMTQIRQTVPVGFNHHKLEQEESWMPDLLHHISFHDSISQDEFQSARFQIGTLGGGNHFIEIQWRNEDGKSKEESEIWIMIHSGSRNIGLKVAKHYNNLAKELNKRWFSSIPLEWDLAFLPEVTDEFYHYVQEMNFCVDFALQNRLLMMQRVKQALLDTVVGNVKFGEVINIPHNYVSIENHYSENVWVHRKGATKAQKGQLGIIPGNQGSKSYIVKGKGTKESFESCSHGAGRIMGRNAARKRLDFREQKEMLDKQGIVHAVRSQNDLDEAPGSYKDIDLVMEYQNDLVDIETELKPLAVIKG